MTKRTKDSTLRVRLPEDLHESIKVDANEVGLSASEIARRRLAQKSDFEKSIKLMKEHKK